MNIPYGSLASAMTQEPVERARLASFRSMGTEATIIALAFIVAPQIKSSDNLQQSLTLTTLLFVVIGFYMLLFSTSKERVARDVLGDANYFIVLTVVSTGVMFVVAGFIPRIVRAVGKKPAYVASSVLAIVAAVGIALTPSSLPGLAIAFYGLYGVGLAAVNTLMWALEADTVEYGEWRTGVRTEGTTYAVFSFTRKVGQAVAGAAAAYGLGFVGYVAQG